MTFEEVLAQVQALLQREKRVSYRGLKRRFALDDEYVEDLKEELIGAKQLATDEDGRFLVWMGGQEPTSIPSSLPAPQPSSPTEPFPVETERRQLTVMFCDLAGSTRLSQQLDPEELHRVIQAYRETCATVIHRFDGYLAEYIGDGLLVYFGYPQAHEDDAQRAVRAGLGIVTALPQLNARLQSTLGADIGAPLQVRIGIHTGLVVAGEMGVGDQPGRLGIVGETPNVAARVQGLANPDTVVISAATYRLVQGLFECQDRGPQTLKGVSTPVLVYCVLAESETQSRFEVAVRIGLTPLVGREEELGVLRRRWEQAKAGEGQIVLLSGEPGIGKSRLVQTLKEQALAEGAIRIEFGCSSYHQNSAFYPIIEYLRRLLQFAPHDPPQTKLARLQQTLARYRFPQADTLPLLAALLSLAPPEDAPPLVMSLQKQKQKTQEALMAWVLEEAEKTAVYCAWEDLHWADPSTLEILTLFLDRVPATRLLALLTFRPDFTPPWRPHSHITPLTLTRLRPPQVERMVEGVTAGKPLPASVLQQIVTKTDGVPLFVEELTRMVLESGLLRVADGHYELTGPLPPLAIPSTLQDSLMARLDRLSTTREIVQLGATLGREFAYELLHAISPFDERTLQQGLRRLVEADLLYQRGVPPQATYLFKHALVQDTAYQSLLKTKRQRYHQQIAQVLEARLTETKEMQPELLAHHYTQAGLIAQALPYWQRAGQRAVERSANVEAIAHLTKGLELVKALPVTPEHIQHELMLQITLGVPLVMTKGYAALEVKKAYTRARELCQELGETSQLFPVLWGLWVFYFVRGELHLGCELGEQLLRLAQRVQDPALLLEAHLALGAILLRRGELGSARGHLEEAIALYDPQQHRSHAFLYGQDPKVACLSDVAFGLWLLGYPDQALERNTEAVTLAQKLAHPFSLAFALCFAAWLQQFRREGQTAREWAEATITLSTEQGFPNWLGAGSIVQGWALAGQGQREEGMAKMHQGLTILRAIGSELTRPYSLALLAEVSGTGSQVEEGLSMVAEALAVAHKNEERFWEAELYRLKGELSLQSRQVKTSQDKSEGRRVGTAHQNVSISEVGTVGGAHPTREAEAERCFWKAIEIARDQQAKSLELRAVMSLSRLWQSQGKTAEARQMLSEVYDWFTEGFGTKDLQETKALLQELA